MPERLAQFVTQRATALMAVVPALLAAGAAADALLAAIGAHDASAILHMFLSPFCHQLAERSLLVDGHSMGLCARCFAIYSSFALVMLSIPSSGPWLARLPQIPLWFVGLVTVPLAIDGTTQLVGLRESTNLLRVVTGTLFGGGLAIFVSISVNKALVATSPEH